MSGLVSLSHRIQRRLEVPRRRTTRTDGTQNEEVLSVDGLGNEVVRLISHDDTPKDHAARDRTGHAHTVAYAMTVMTVVQAFYGSRRARGAGRHRWTLQRNGFDHRLFLQRYPLYSFAREAGSAESQTDAQYTHASRVTRYIIIILVEEVGGRGFGCCYEDALQTCA